MAIELCEAQERFVPAIDALLDEQRNIMVGVVHDDIVYVPFTKAIKDDKPVDAVLMDVLKALSC